MREMGDFHIDEISRLLTDGNLELLLENNFRERVRSGANMRVFASHYTHTGTNIHDRTFRHVASSATPNATTRNVVFLNPLTLREVTTGIIQEAVIQATSSPLLSEENQRSLEFAVPVQVGRNHWVLAYLTPNMDRGYHLTFVDSLADPAAEKAALLKSAQDFGSAADARRISAAPLENSRHCTAIFNALSGRGGIVTSCRELSCGQQKFSGSEGLGDEKAYQGQEYNEHYWSCGFIVAENAEMLAIRRSVHPAEKYTASSKERMFLRAQAALRIEALAHGIIDDAPEMAAQPNAAATVAAKKPTNTSSPSTQVSAVPASVAEQKKGTTTASPAVTQATKAPAEKAADKAKIEADLKKAYEESQKKQLEIIAEEEKLAKLLVNAPFKVLDLVLTNLEEGIKGLNFSNATNALLSICGLLKSIASIVPSILLSVKDTVEKADVSNKKTHTAEAEHAAQESKISKLHQERIAALTKAIVESGKKAASNPTGEATLEPERQALQKTAEESVKLRKSELPTSTHAKAVRQGVRRRGLSSEEISL